MERYWCLRWLTQESIRVVDAVVLKDEVLRLTDIPLVIQMPGLQSLARGAQVRLELLHWDEVDLSVQARLLEVVATPLQVSEAETEVETEAEEDTLVETPEVENAQPENNAALPAADNSE